jgi:hypothetical protein
MALQEARTPHPFGGQDQTFRVPAAFGFARIIREAWLAAYGGWLQSRQR